MSSQTQSGEYRCHGSSNAVAALLLVDPVLNCRLVNMEENYE
jgi:hypothetical protein